MSARDDLYLFAMVGKIQEDGNREMAVAKLDAYRAEARVEVLREMATEIQTLGEDRGWSIWAAHYMHPDIEFLDTGGLDTATLLRGLKAEHRAEVLAEGAAAIYAYSGHKREFYAEMLLRMAAAGTEEKTTPRVGTAVTPQPEATPDVRITSERDPGRRAAWRMIHDRPDTDTERLTILRTAIAEWQGEWTTAQTFHLYRARGIGNGQRSQARADLKILHREGLLVLHDLDPSHRHYTLNSSNGSTR